MKAIPQAINHKKRINAGLIVASRALAQRQFLRYTLKGQLRGILRMNYEITCILVDVSL